MNNPFSVRRRGVRTVRPARIAAIVVVLGAGAVLPIGAVGASGAGSSAPATPCVLVAVDDFFSTSQDTPLSVVAPGVGANDITCGLDIQAISTTANGSLTVNADGSFLYTPNAGYSGPDGFDYILAFPPAPTLAGRASTEGVGRLPRGVAESGHVDIDVIPAPEPPCVPVSLDDSYETAQDVTLVVGLPGVKVNDTDCGFFVHLFANPSNGALVLNDDGTFEYTPDPGFTGVDTFQYALAELPPGFAGGSRLEVRGWRAPQGAGDNVAFVTIVISGAPTTSTSTTVPPTTTIAPTGTTTPTPTTTAAPPPDILPATR